jgi:exosortase
VDTEASVKVLDYGGGSAEPKRGAQLGVAPGWWEALGPIGVAKITVIVALVSWFYGDHFYRLYRVWLQPDWSHGFLVPVFCLYLVHMRRAELLSGDHVGSLWGLAVMLFAVAMYAASIYAKYGYPQPLSILVMIVGTVLLIRGWRTLWLTAFPIAFLFLAIPPPVRLYRHFSQPLQQFAAAVSASLLNALPGVVEVERAGINLAFYMEGGHEGTFTVAGACSGMRSLMAFVALGLAMAYLGRRPLWHRIVLCVCVVPVAVCCNILRVIITGSLQMYGHEELAGGSSHAILGLLMFALGFTVYLAVLWALDHVFVEEPDEPDVDEAIPAGGQAS